MLALMSHRIAPWLLLGWALAPDLARGAARLAWVRSFAGGAGPQDVILASSSQPPGARRPASRARADREAVLKLLGASERAPSEKELRALGDEVDAVLIALASDAKLEPRMRARAVSALAFAPSSAARGFLGQLVGNTAVARDATDVLLIRRAAMALGGQGGPAVPPLLAGLLEHADPEVRVDAALALGLTRLSSAADLLRARLEVESDGRVRGHISRQLRVVENAIGQEPTQQSQENRQDEGKPDGKAGGKPPTKRPP